MEFLNAPRFVALALAAVFAHPPCAAAEPVAAGGSGYHVVGSVALPGDGAGDYLALDADARRLYVTHSDSVQVLDADSLQMVGTIAGTPHCHGVVLLDKLGKGFVSSGQPGGVVVFDLKTLKHLDEIHSSPDTDGIAYDPASGYVFTFNGDSKNATVIDPATDSVVKILDLGGDPEAAAADGKGLLFDNLKDKSEVIRINTGSLRIEKRWPLAPGQSPSGMAMDRGHRRLFIGCRDELLVVMDADSGRIVQTLPIGGRIDATVFDPASGTVFNSCGDGTLSVIHEDSPDKFHIVENAPTELGAKTMAFDPHSGRVFLSTARWEAPPAQTKTMPKIRRKIVPGSFHVLALSR
ncbi:MAG TPA: YncE family protein [bacterium]|jgi:DNA-binding beta-propeller fold protein YncE|nr:YncE family protein [bacterium]